ncbi:hypothetical protein KY329_04115 [Candidatus Woesearchaeota archaeon]|nr:hypothetical protein [Candidatus Woesearchaeota archaeon]
MIGSNITYMGPAAQKESVLKLLETQLAMMGGLVDADLQHLVDGILIRAEEFPNEDGFSMDRRYIAEFQTIPDERHLAGRFVLPGQALNDEREFVPQGFYIAPDSSPEALIQNLWLYGRDTGLGQKEATGEYPMGKLVMKCLSTYNMNRMTEERKRALIPKANGSTAYSTRAKSVIQTIPFDDQRRTMTEMWYECEPTPDMSAGEMAQRITEVIMTGMANQLAERELNPRVVAEVEQLGCYQRAIARIGSHSKNHSVTNRGRFSYFGIPQKLFCAPEMWTRINLDPVKRREQIKELQTAAGSLLSFHEAVLNREDVYDPLVQEETTRQVEYPIFATSDILPRIVNGQLFI